LGRKPWQREGSGAAPSRPAGDAAACNLRSLHHPLTSAPRPLDFSLPHSCSTHLLRMASPPPPWANSQPLVQPYAAAAAPWLTHGTPAPGSSPAPTSDMPPPSAAPSPQVASAASDGKPQKPRMPRPKKDPAAGAGAGANARAGSSTATPAPGALADAAAAAGDEGASGGRKPKKKATKKAASRAGSVSTRAGSVARATPAAAVGEGDARHEGEGTPAPPTTAAGQQLEAEQRQRQQRGTVEESSEEEEEDEEDEGALDAQDLESIERSHERKKGEIG